MEYHSQLTRRLRWNGAEGRLIILDKWERDTGAHRVGAILIVKKNP